MKVQEIRKKTREELVKILDEKIKKLNEVRFSEKIGRPKNVKERASLRKEIARIKTILNEKENH
ncbi:MAG: 50S ribosomal protein L29 [Candidatus Pacebacteria bacterium]|nr:50S ribosomal protein L29 [Candidatus Paceibacterota bacterium]